MASSVIHLAIMKKFIEKNPDLGINKKEAYAGTLYPDVTDNKDITHYTDNQRGKDNISHLKGKVNLYSFLQDHEIKNSFTLGWFIHLLTDYLFFSECFDDQYLINTSYEDFRKDLYYAYDCLTSYLSKKYNIVKEDYISYPSEYYEGSSYKKCLFTKSQIDNFIERVSSIHLDTYIPKIKENKQNMKPED